MGAKTRRGYKHGIFALETSQWYGNLKCRTSVRPMLSMLEDSSLKVPYIYRDVAVHEEFWHFLKKWTQKAYENYPILYLLFHGEPGQIIVGEGKNNEIELNTVAERLEGKCKGKIIIFSSCSTLDKNARWMNSFLRSTKAEAVIGYRIDVDWMESVLFEMLLLCEFQSRALDLKGLRKSKSEVDKAVARSGLKKGLDYGIIIRKARKRRTKA